MRSRLRILHPASQLLQHIRRRWPLLRALLLTIMPGAPHPLRRLRLLVIAVISSSGSSSSSRAKAKELGVSGLGMSSEAVAEVLDGLGRCVGWQQHEFSGPLVWSLVGYSDPLAHLNDLALDPGLGQRQGGGR